MKQLQLKLFPINAFVYGSMWD